MDIGATIFWGVIGGLTGLGLSKYLGFNFFQIISTVSGITAILPLIWMFISATADSSHSTNYVEPMVAYLTNILPDVLAGDIAAGIVASIAGRG